MLKQLVSLFEEHVESDCARAVKTPTAQERKSLKLRAAMLIAGASTVFCATHASAQVTPSTTWQSVQLTSVSGYQSNSAGNLIQNGDFSASQNVSGSSTTWVFDSWQTNYDVIGSSAPAQLYAPSISTGNSMTSISATPIADITGRYQNGLTVVSPDTYYASQSVTLVVGQTYLLQFSLTGSSGNGANTDGIGFVSLGYGTFDLLESNDLGAAAFVAETGVTVDYQLVFTATDTDLTLLLLDYGYADESTSGWAQSAGTVMSLSIFDNVILTPIPEVNSTTLWMGGLVFVAISSRRRKWSNRLS